MTRQAPSSPAWYRDPDDPVRLRHWNGGVWDGRRRTAPAWTRGTSELATHPNGRREGDPVLEGPVHPAALPATAAATAQSVGARPNLLTRGRPSGPLHSGRTSAGTTQWSGAARPTGRSWSGRAAFMTMFALVGVAVLVLAGVVGIHAPRTSVSTVAANVGFVDAANEACGEAIGAARAIPTTTGGGTSTAGAEATVRRDNADLEQLAARIRGLPLDPGPEALVFGWLVTWSQFATARNQWAAIAARPVRRSTALASSNALTHLDLAAADADGFATANGLRNCTLSARASLQTAT